MWRKGYLCKDLLFLAECVLISPHIAALFYQTMQTYPPLDPNWNGYWLVHRKLQPWQPAVWQILWWRRSREENWACRCLFPDSQTDRHRHLCGVYTVGDSMVKILKKNDDLSCFCVFNQALHPPTYVSDKPPADGATHCSSSFIFSVCFCVCLFFILLWRVSREV